MLQHLSLFFASVAVMGVVVMATRPPAAVPLKVMLRVPACRIMPFDPYTPRKVAL